MQWDTVQHLHSRILALIFVFSVAISVSGQSWLDSKRIVFPKESLVLLDLIPDSSFQRFTPNREEVDSVDRYLSLYLAEMDDQPGRKVNIAGYNRQYVGVVMKGRKCVFINAACRLTDSFSKNTAYPKGGGTCFFRTLIDLDQKEVLSCLFNAPK